MKTMKKEKTKEWNVPKRQTQVTRETSGVKERKRDSNNKELKRQVSSKFRAKDERRRVRQYIQPGDF
jgi:hypothetical protein